MTLHSPISTHPDYWLAGEVKERARLANRMRQLAEARQRSNATTRINRAELIRQGFELAPESIVGHRLIITGRMVGGSMHSIIPMQELVGVDREGNPVLHIVHGADPATAMLKG